MRLCWIPAALIAGTTVLGGGIVLATAGPALADPGSPNAAVVVKDAGCTLLDGNGNIAVASSSHIVITVVSGGTTLKCSGSVPASATGQAVRYSGLPCGTALGLTTDMHETVSAGGQATMTCRVTGSSS